MHFTCEWKISNFTNFVGELQYQRSSKYKLAGSNKQLLDEADHDIKNHPDRGQCYLAKPNTENIDRGLDTS